jgi:uncharacterized protein YegL
MKEIVFVLDRSGSMGGLESDVIGGFNKFITEQKKEEGKAEVTVVLFDHEYNILYDRLDLKKVEPLTSKEYWARGNTALLDAIGKTIEALDARLEDDDQVLFIINTDGFENSSTQYDNKKIAEMVTHHQDELEWKFIFLGANIDSFATGGNIGISSNTTRNYTASSKGVASVYASVSNLTSSWRASTTGDVDTEELNTIQ